MPDALIYTLKTTRPSATEAEYARYVEEMNAVEIQTSDDLPVLTARYRDEKTLKGLVENSAVSGSPSVHTHTGKKMKEDSHIQKDEYVMKENIEASATYLSKEAVADKRHWVLKCLIADICTLTASWRLRQNKVWWRVRNLITVVPCCSQTFRMVWSLKNKFPTLDMTCTHLETSKMVCKLRMTWRIREVTLIYTGIILYPTQFQNGLYLVGQRSLNGESCPNCKRPKCFDYETLLFARDDAFVVIFLDVITR